MIDREIKAYVTKASGNLVSVMVMDQEIKLDLINLGFHYNNEYDEFSINVNDNNEKAILFSKLRDLDIAFSTGREWSPAEVFEFLRDSKLIQGMYLKISWSKPDTYSLRQV